MNNTNHPRIAEIEPEVKYFDIDLDLVRNKLRTAEATLKTPERLMRRVVFGSEANNLMTCSYGRVRDEGGTITMSAKFSAKNGDIGSQKEIMLTVDSFERAVSLIETFGVVSTDYQENKRETWQMPDGTLVELEQWPQLPTYIEIESYSVEGVRATSDALGMDWAKHTTDSTEKLYAKYFHELSKVEVQRMVADLRFEK